MLPTDKQARKERPIASGVMSYFPDAIAEVAHVSYVGNQQHNPGQPMHWARHKSTDHADCIARHLTERGTIDDDGMRHSAKAAWRALALLQLELEGVAYHQADGSPVHNPVGYRTGVDMASGPDTSVAFTVASSNPEVYPLPETEALNDWLIAREEEPRKSLLTRNAQSRDANEIFHLGCKSDVADQIALGTTYSSDSTRKDKYVYIAGPMRGYPEFNFPAFDAARNAALPNGWNVISPADIDRVAGIKEDEHKDGDATPFDQRTFVYRDFYALYFIAHTEGGAIYMLPGWEKSTGAVAEFFLARWLGLKIFNAKTGSVLLTSQVNFPDIYASVRNFLNDQFQRSE